MGLQTACARDLHHAFDELRSKAAAARRDRGLGVVERDDIAGEPVVHEHRHAAGFEFEAGQGGVVTYGGRHLVSLSETCSAHTS